MNITIKKIGINGEGIGYDHKIPVFVKGALLDEVVACKIVEDHKRYKVAEIVKIIERSPLRKKESCSYFKSCGGCSLLHTNYENQLAIKKEILEESLSKYAGIEWDVEVVESFKQAYYRNSLKLPFGMIDNRLYTGMYQDGTNRFIRIDSCMNHDERLELMRKEVVDLLNKYHLKAYDKKTRKGLRYLYLRVIDDKMQMCLVTGQDKLDPKLIYELNHLKGLYSIYQSIHTSKSTASIFGSQMIQLSNKKYLDFEIDDLKMRLSVRSFFQLNTLQAQNLYHYVKACVKDNQEFLIEAYSGIGAMALMMHDKAQKIVGIESVMDAVNNANTNAKKNGFEHISFICGDAAEMIKAKFRHQKIDTIIVDPPRSGLDDMMIETLLKAKISNIIYISCNPATLAKNLYLLKSRYKIESIKAFDMFPNTAHIESVVCLSRK